MIIRCFQDVYVCVSAPEKYNDPGMLVVGKLGPGWGVKSHDSDLTADEQYAYISLWSILSAPLLLDCDMTIIDDLTLGLLINPEVIAVNQDPLATPATKLIVPNGQIWYKKLYDGSCAFGFSQMDPHFTLWDQDKAVNIQQQKYSFNFALNQLGIQGRVRIRDLWRQKSLGILSGSYETSIPYHGVSLIKTTPIK